MVERGSHHKRFCKLVLLGGRMLVRSVRRGYAWEKSPQRMDFSTYHPGMLDAWGIEGGCLSQVFEARGTSLSYSQLTCAALI